MDDLLFRTPKGKYVSIVMNVGTTYLNWNVPYYATTNCTGQVYGELKYQQANARELYITNSIIRMGTVGFRALYTPSSFVSEDISTKSYKSLGNCVTSTTAKTVQKVVPISAEDAGVPNNELTFALPITID